jgi:acyl-CoA reductase-like NAD-dependent aldehyde dehydrogenase
METRTPTPGGMQVRPFLLAGRRTLGRETMEIRSPYDHRPVARVGVPTPQQIVVAAEAADAARAPLAAVSPEKRAHMLDHAAVRLRDGADQLPKLITDQQGLPIRASRQVVARAAEVLHWAADETLHWHDWSAAAGRSAVVASPRSAVIAVGAHVTPVNLQAAVLGAALGVGAPIVFVPSPVAPVAPLVLAEILAETDLPPGSVSVLPLPPERSDALVMNRRFPVVVYAGPAATGWAFKEELLRKRLLVEPGGYPVVLVMADADVRAAARSVAAYMGYQAGHSGIGVQRVLVHNMVYDAFLDALVDAAGDLTVGNPFDESTDLGPVCSDRVADTFDGWISDAVAAGARLVAGGTRRRNAFAPTVLVDVPDELFAGDDVVSGPAAAISRFGWLHEAAGIVAAMPERLSAGVFTHNAELARRAFDALPVGAVTVGRVPSFRLDPVPDGTAHGDVVRAGLRRLMREMTYERVFVSE